MSASQTAAPSADTNAPTTARERFIAFAFAAGDLMLEIAHDGHVIFAAGQLKSLTGHDEKSITDADWLTLFAKKSHGDLRALLKGVQKAGKLGPIMTALRHKDSEILQQAIVMGMTLPNSPHIYLSINARPSFFDFLTVGDFDGGRLLNEKQFEAAAIKAFQTAKSQKQDLDVTFLEMDEIEKFRKSLSFKDAENFSVNLQSILKEQSYGGQTASQVDENKFALIHDRGVTPALIEEKIAALVKRTAGDGEKDIGLKRKTIDSELESLNEREARRALIYTINKMEENGVDAVQEGLSAGFDDYLQENAAKILRLKSLVGQQAFRLNFQPIVSLADETLCHYEALVRFDTKNQNESPYELIVFGEDIGIAADVDMAILKQAIGTIQSQKHQDPALKIAVNISGQSIQKEHFIEKMIAAIEESQISPDNLLFEITESTAIADLETVNKYIQQLRKRGFEICLDDFGAGAASFQYLNAFDIDCVKIDGKYIRDALNSTRDEAMVRNLARMCKDLGITTIAEMVETKEQRDYLTSIGVDKAQGWLFGKPQAKPVYRN